MSEYFETDKLDTPFTIRIPACTKAMLDKLPNDLRKKMHNQILLVMAKTIHESGFEASVYLKSQ